MVCPDFVKEYFVLLAAFSIPTHRALAFAVCFVGEELFEIY